MRLVFEEETRFQKMLDVEAALARARAEVGDIPSSAAEEIERHASMKYVKLERIREIEKVTEHETMASSRGVSGGFGKRGRLRAFRSHFLGYSRYRSRIADEGRAWNCGAKAGQS